MAALDPENARVPIVYGYTVVVELPANPIKRAFRRWSWRRLYHEMDCVVVASSVLRDSLHDRGIRTRIEVILNEVELKNFYPAAGYVPNVAEYLKVADLFLFPS